MKAELVCPAVVPVNDGSDAKDGNVFPTSIPVEFWEREWEEASAQVALFVMPQQGRHLNSELEPDPLQATSVGAPEGREERKDFEPAPNKRTERRGEAA
jgi:hypothetical protein